MIYPCTSTKCVVCNINGFLGQCVWIIHCVKEVQNKVLLQHILEMFWLLFNQPSMPWNNPRGSLLDPAQILHRFMYNTWLKHYGREAIFVQAKYFERIYALKLTHCFQRNYLVKYIFIFYREGGTSKSQRHALACCDIWYWYSIQFHKHGFSNKLGGQNGKVHSHSHAHDTAMQVE